MMTIPGLPLDEGLGSMRWRETSATMLRFSYSAVAGFSHAAPRFLELPHATFHAQLYARFRGQRVKIRLEVVVPDGATPHAPLPVDAPFWQSISALSTHLGGPTLPLPDGPAGALESGRPYVGSGVASWTHAGISVEVKTNRLEHVAVFDIFGPDPRTLPRKRRVRSARGDT
jgi:hypothetical protein